MKTAAPRKPLRSLDQALFELLDQVTVIDSQELVSTFDGDRRVLAQDLVAALNVPALDNSSMDGYAVRCTDVHQAWTQSRAVELPLSQRIAAGDCGAALQPGTAARIFTGAPLPAGADAVLMQEDCETCTLPDARVGVRIKALPTPGQWIRRAGEDIRQGEVILPRGRRLTAAELGLAASIGLDFLPLRRRPRVALFSTGNELVMPGAVPPQQLAPGSIYNSNRFFLRAMLQRIGCEVSDLGIVPDRLDATVQALRAAATGNDLILTSGGVSVGEEDHVKPAVESLGRLDLWQIAIKPGKPFAYGQVLGAHFIGLPGNPVSSFVTFLLLVRPFLLKLQGASKLDVAIALMRANFDWPRADKRREFLRVRRSADGGVDLFPNQSSGVLTSAVWGDGLVDNPGGQTIARGEMVQFISFSELLS